MISNQDSVSTEEAILSVGEGQYDRIQCTGYVVKIIMKLSKTIAKKCLAQYFSVRFANFEETHLK